MTGGKLQRKRIEAVRDYVTKLGEPAGGGGPRGLDDME